MFQTFLTPQYSRNQEFNKAENTNSDDYQNNNAKQWLLKLANKNLNNNDHFTI